MDPGTWSVIGTNFDPDDETANFGTRRALEAEGRLFDVFTYATIDPKGDVINNPSLLSESSQSQLALCLDSCLHVFGEDFRPEQIISLKFSSNFDTIAWTPCRRFLIAGLRTGHAQLVHLSTGKPLPQFSLCVSEEDGSDSGPMFVGSACFGPQDNCQLQLISREGKIYSLTGVNLDGLDEGLTGNDVHKLVSLRNAIHSTELSIDFGSEQKCQITSTKLFRDEVENIDTLVALKGGRLARLIDNLIVDVTDISGFDTSIDDDNDVHILRVPKVQSRRNVAFCVDRKGKLSVVCLHTMMAIWEWNQEKVIDFVLLEDEGDSVVKMMMITQRQTNVDVDVRTLLQIREFPSFNVLYELEVFSFCRLLDTGINQESPMILEGSSTLVKGLVTGLRIRGICEGSAEARLTRLLRRKKFDEAEKFAVSNRLSLEEVHQARAASLIEQLSPWKVSSCQLSVDQVTSLFDVLRKTLLSMSGLEHMVRCCVEAAMPSLLLTKELLILARTAIQNNTDRDMDNSLMGHVCHTLHRLETFTFIGNTGSKFKEELFTDPRAQEVENVNAWIRFSRVDMLEEYCNRLAEGHLKPATLIWKRHQAEFSRSLTCDLITEILNEMPPGWSVDTKLKWLSHFLPDCLNILPDCLPVVAKWTVEATKALEMSERKGWPANGLNFAASVLETMLTFGNQDNTECSELKSSKVLLMLHQQRTDSRSDLYVLSHLIETLKDLKILHENFRFRIKLSDFDVQSKSEVTVLVLDWFQSAQEMEDVLKRFLLSYMEKMNLDSCKVLSQYAKSLIENSGFCWYWEVGSAPWEEKVSLLLSHIQPRSEHRSKIVLQCLQTAPVPWSSTIQGIANEGKKSGSEEMAENIREQEQLVILKQILLKYDCKSFSVSGRVLSGRESERLLQCIIKRGADFEEVLQVAQLMDGLQKVDAVMFYIQQLISNDDHSRALQIFRQMEDASELQILSLKMLIHAELSFEYCKCVNAAENAAENRAQLPIVLFLKGASMILKCKKGLETEIVDEFLHKSDQIYRRFSLFHHFGLKASDLDMIEPNASRHIQDLIQLEVKKSGSESKVIHKQLIRLSKLFDLSYESCLGQLLLVMAETKNYVGFVDCVQQLIVERNVSLSPDLATFILQSIPAMYRALKDGDQIDANEIPITELLNCMQSLAAISVSVCDESQLSTFIFASAMQNYFGVVQKQFHDQRVFSNVNLSVDTYSQAKFSPQFLDKGLPLDPSVLRIPLEFCTSVIDQRLACVDFQPNLAFCQLDDVIKSNDVTRDEKSVQIESLHWLLRRHCSELGSLGHSALPLLCVKLSELALINVSLQFGEEFAQKMVNLYQEDQANAAKNVIPKILSERKPDLSLGLGYLLFLDPSSRSKTALKIMMSTQATFGTDFRKVAALGRLGMRFCCHKSLRVLSSHYEQFKQLCVKSIWGRRAEDVGVRVNVAKLFSGNSLEEDHMKLLAELVDKSITDPTVQFTVEDLVQYSRAFGLDDRAVRKNYVTWCVTSTALEPTINADNLVEKPQNFDKVIDQIDQAFGGDFLNDDRLAALSALMPPFFSDISPYNYEVLQTVVAKWRQFCESSIPECIEPESQQERTIAAGLLQLERTENILNFLVHYKRCHPPTENEVDTWLKKYFRPFPKIGHIRLPLHNISELGTKDAFKFVSGEFQLSSYKAWIESSRVFRFSADNIRLITVKNTVQALTQSATPSDSDGWNLSSVHGSVLVEVEACLVDIVNLLGSTSSVHFMLNRLTRGVDKLFAARLCTVFAEKWFDEAQDDSSEKARIFAYQVQLKLEVENILAKFGLIATTVSVLNGAKVESDQPLLDLIHQGRYEDLVTKLYEHESIAERNELVVSKGGSGGPRFPDINGAVAEIAGLSSSCKAAEQLGIDTVKLTKLKYRLLDRWLPEKVALNSNNGLDETMSNMDFLQNFNKEGQNTSGGSDDISRENEINFLRCVYLLQGCECYNYTLQIAYTQDPMYTTMHKLRALKCVLSVVSSDHEALVFLNDLNIDATADFDIEQHLQALVFVARLEKLNLSYDLNAFISCKKPALIESLLRSSGHLPDGLSLIIDLCLAYDVFPPILWSALLKQMCRLGLTNHLRRVLSELNRQPTLWHLPQFLDAWNKLLTQPFNTASLPITAECLKSCQKSVELLEHCPIASDVNINLILGECQRLNLQDLAQQIQSLTNLMGSKAETNGF